MRCVARLLGSVLVAAALVGMACAEEGVVLSTIDSEGYTYIEVDQNGRKIWIATNTIQLRVGDRLQFDPGMDMTNFRSSSLQRTFPTMRFVTHLKVVNKQLQQLGSDSN